MLCIILLLTGLTVWFMLEAGQCYYDYLFKDRPLYGTAIMLTLAICCAMSVWHLLFIVENCLK